MTCDYFNWMDIPARTRKQWWSLSNDNKARVYEYYRTLWYLMQESEVAPDMGGEK